jgi:phosphate transport system substrate-binding protein
MAYEKLNHVHIEYQPVGSTSGLREVAAGVVDFAVSDAPLDDYQLLREGLAQFPVVIGAIVPIVNLDGITAGQLRLTGQLLAEIYLGKVTHWRDPAIAALNPGLNLPDQAIFVIHRSDGSGTTFNWTDYLSKVSDEWKVKVGTGTLIAWPTGLGGKGNTGVAESVARAKGGIGYVEYGYAQRRKLSYVVVRNRAGRFVPPDLSSFREAVADIDWTRVREFYVSMSDAGRENAYPIMAASFALIHRYPQNAAHSNQALAFFRWALENGQDMATSLDYLPLSPTLVQQVMNYWDAN